MFRTILLSIAGIVVAGVLFVSYNWWQFAQSIEIEMAALGGAARSSGETVSDERLALLPEPVQRHLRQAGVVGQDIPRLIQLTQTGRIRNGVDAPWLDFEAAELYSTNPPGFVWRAWFPTEAMPLVFGRDHYLDGDGAITIKALGTLAIADIGGAPEMQHAALMRYLNEMMWFPAALAGRNLDWRAIDDTHAEVSLTDHGVTATAQLVFDTEGRLVNFIGRRFDTNTDALQIWETPMTDYATFAGMTIPSKGSALYRYPDGPFTYVEAEVTGVTLE